MPDGTTDCIYIPAWRARRPPAWGEAKEDRRPAEVFRAAVEEFRAALEDPRQAEAYRAAVEEFRAALKAGRIA
jgi:hypothetical protein